MTTLRHTGCLKSRIADATDYLKSQCLSGDAACMIVHFADGHVHMANKKLDVYNFSVGYSPLSSLLPSVCVCVSIRFKEFRDFGCLSSEI